MQTPIKVDQLLLTHIWEELSCTGKAGSQIGVYEELNHALVFILPSNEVSVQKLGMLSQLEVANLPEPISWEKTDHLLFVRHKYGDLWGPWLTNEQGFR